MSAAQLLARDYLRGQALNRLKWVFTLLIAAGTAAAGTSVVLSRDKPGHTDDVAVSDAEWLAVNDGRSVNDADGDPLPSGAVMRLGSARFRTADRILALAYTPDGSHLVFWTDHVNPGTGQVDATAVFTIQADGTRLVQVTPQSMLAGDCDWSPDGTRLVFATHPLVAFNFDPVVSNLFTARPDGTGLRQLTHSATANNRATQAHFTPDGRIIYTRVTPTGRTLWLINADGSDGAPIPANGERIRTHGDWQPTPG